MHDQAGPLSDHLIISSSIILFFVPFVSFVTSWPSLLLAMCAMCGYYKHSPLDLQQGIRRNPVPAPPNRADRFNM